MDYLDFTAEEASKCLTPYFNRTTDSQKISVFILEADSCSIKP
jgi:hypothetical protein